jgi:uncharacterized protein YbjT (DUF2867 family)
MIEIAGPDRGKLNEFVARYLKATNDPREVTADKNAPYFEVQVDDTTLVPGNGARIGAIRFDEWLSHSARKAA